MQIAHVVGARPNFMKIGPIMRALAGQAGVDQTLVHTGQHYDVALSGRLFEDLEIPSPDLNLEVGSDGHASQMGRIMIALAPALESLRPDWVVTVGDVNSTLAAALTAVQLGLRVAHVEAGLRSGDRTMPEEVNRILTDRLSDILFATEPDALENLAREGVNPDRVHLVGNVMIDTLDRYLGTARALGVPASHGLAPGSYVLVTLHRPNNVDVADRLEAWLRALRGVAELTGREVVFPVHPRTASRIEMYGLEGELARLTCLPPLGYLEFVGLMSDAAAIVTDSGGIQEEATVLGVPCVTVRPSTERPITVMEGTNRLFDASPSGLPAVVVEAVEEERRPHRPEGWDGRAADRIAGLLVG